WVGVRESEKIRKIFIRIAKRQGRKKAIVAIGRKTLVWSWHLVVNEENWEEFCKRNPTEKRSGMTLKRLLNQRDEFIKKNSET
ncbi:MAG: hypothetical protein ACP5QD_00625, partial [Candidatus Ratteibacteria bacterium]